MTDHIQDTAPRPGAPGAAGRKGARVQRPGAGKLVAMALAAGLCVVAVAAAGLGLYSAYGYSKVYPGVRVEGQNLGGLTRAQALERVDALLRERTPGHGFKLKVGDTIFPIAIGLEDVGFDAQKTAELAWAYGREGGLGHRLSQIWKAVGGGVEIKPACAIGTERLTLRAEEIARDTAQSIVQASFRLEGDKVILDRGLAGVGLTAEGLATFLLNKVAAGDFSDTEYALSYEEPTPLDLLLIKKQVDTDGQEARLDLAADPAGGVIIPARADVRLDLEKARLALESTSDRWVEVPLKITPPPYTTEEFKALLFRDVLAKGTTEFNAALKGRTTNVLLANGLCNGVILNPGDVFSYNQTVGPRTYERGFQDAIVYVGTSAEDGVGGGICQVSSTLYYAALRADLEIVERRAHSRMVTYVPLGEDATVAWGSVDFKFKNNTDFPIRVVTANTKNTITVQLLGTQTVANKEVRLVTTKLSNTPFETVYQIDPTLPVGTEKVDHTGYTGWRTETYREVYIDGVQVSRTFENKSAYTKYDKIILHNPPPPATEPTVPSATEPTAPVVDIPVIYPTEPGATEPEVTEPEAREYTDD